jgi:hypothetical protein
MPFPADESFIYQMPSSEIFTLSSLRRYSFSGGIPTNNSRLITRVTTNIPNSYEPSGLGLSRRVVSNNLQPIEPFSSAPYSSTTSRQVAAAFPANGVASLSDYLTFDYYIGERDVYRWYAHVYLSRLDKAKLRMGRLGSLEYTNLTYLYSLASSSFVTGATLPELPTY